MILGHFSGKTQLSKMMQPREPCKTDIIFKTYPVYGSRSMVLMGGESMYQSAVMKPSAVSLIPMAGEQ